MLSCFSPVRLFATLWTIAHSAPLSMGFSRQEYWGGLLCPPPGYLPNPGIEPASLTSPALSGGFFTTSKCRLGSTNIFGLEKSNFQHQWYFSSFLTAWTVLSAVSSEVSQLCPTLCNPMDCNLTGSSVHGIFQARILEWVAMPSSRGSS